MQFSFLVLKMEQLKKKTCMYVPLEIISCGLTLLSSVWLRVLLSGCLEVINVWDLSLAGTDFDSFSIQSGMAWCVKSWGWMSKPTQIQKPTMEVRPLQFLQGCITLEQLDQGRWPAIEDSLGLGVQFHVLVRDSNQHLSSASDRDLISNSFTTVSLMKSNPVVEQTISLLGVYQKMFLQWTLDNSI